MRVHLSYPAVTLLAAAAFAAPVPAAEVPAVRVIASNPGASAQVMVDTVTAPLEQQLRGMDGVTSIQSESRDGRAVITVYLKRNTNVPVAQVLVQNRVAL